MVNPARTHAQEFASAYRKNVRSIHFSHRVTSWMQEFMDMAKEESGYDPPKDLMFAVHYALAMKRHADITPNRQPLWKPSVDTTILQLLAHAPITRAFHDYIVSNFPYLLIVGATTGHRQALEGGLGISTERVAYGIFDLPEAEVMERFVLDYLTKLHHSLDPYTVHDDYGLRRARFQELGDVLAAESGNAGFKSLPEDLDQVVESHPTEGIMLRTWEQEYSKHYHKLLRLDQPSTLD